MKINDDSHLAANGIGMWILGKGLEAILGNAMQT